MIAYCMAALTSSKSVVAAGGKAAEEGLLRPVDGRYESHDAPLKTIRHGHIRHNVQC